MWNILLILRCLPRQAKSLKPIFFDVIEHSCRNIMCYNVLNISTKRIKAITTAYWFPIFNPHTEPCLTFFLLLGFISTPLIKWSGAFVRLSLFSHWELQPRFIVASWTLPNEKRRFILTKDLCDMRIVLQLVKKIIIITEKANKFFLLRFIWLWSSTLKVLGY